MPTINTLRNLLLAAPFLLSHFVLKRLFYEPNIINLTPVYVDQQSHSIIPIGRITRLGHTSARIHWS